ncbi:hypothetical protein [Aquimarina algicola]|uniref:Uncharacterized protein n=1 Tax=Aquimarina algicola TaxID=2589995 RepID=A0A504J8A5_9FLAO|nr:hypothetical protein [Aquimarina algicola]TPN87087.1 hypothetical protein FHK87_05715 [Aquimarina algicola]
MNKKIINSSYLKNDPKHDKFLQNLAKQITLECFRNSYLEDLHKGVSPYTKTGDYSDVKIITPKGEISWNELSRINNEEMQRLIVEVVDRVFTAIDNLTYPSFSKELRGFINKNEIAPEWVTPKLITNDIFKDEDLYWENRVASAKEHQKNFRKRILDNLK